MTGLPILIPHFSPIPQTSPSPSVNAMDRFIIVGSGCSGAVPLCNHLFKGIHKDCEEINRKAEIDSACCNPNLLADTPSFDDRPKVRHQLSGSEGPCSSDIDSTSSGDGDLLPLRIPDIRHIPFDLWASSIHDIAPSFELFTRNLLIDFQSTTRCRCRYILENGPKTVKERRNNVSCLVQIAAVHASELKDPSSWYSNVLVDAGKTFRESCLNVLVPNKVTSLDEVLITHEHADASGGLDDLREFQRYEVQQVEGTTRHVCKRALVICTGKDTADGLVTKYPYCFNSDQWVIQPDGSIHMNSRWPAFTIDALESHFTPSKTCRKRIDTDDPITTTKILETGYKKIVLSNGKTLPTSIYPMFHGGEYISMGFGFGNQQKVLYLSDVKAIAQSVMETMCVEGPWHMLVIDCLTPMKYHFSHATLYEVLQWARCINPKIIRLVGMTCIFPPDDTKALLDRWLSELKATELRYNRGYCGLNENEQSNIEDIDLSYDGETFELSMVQ